ncbi:MULTISPECIES: AraC family transcriptional regulator [Nonomuraea]|uniref:Helix-turn-helix domain-containing protein n=1 Tax=Nonomuraea mangrovi TaxID=2316207 RepID=A0ABW4SKQ1_9ACTN
MRVVEISLDEPPEVVDIGVGLHGVSRRHDTYLLPELWQFHLYGYSAELTVAGTPHAIEPGFVSLIPPGTQARYRYRGPSEHLYVHFRAPGGAGAHAVPVMQNAGVQAPALSDMLRAAIAAAPQAPARTAAEIWTALWRVATLSGGDHPHPAVAAAISHIEAHLASPLSVSGVARVAGVSHNHLTRLFHAEMGVTVVAYIHRRRMIRARHLLAESTMPISAVAAAVGMRDLQAFNKACRRTLGAAPRVIRASGSSADARPAAGRHGG